MGEKTTHQDVSRRFEAARLYAITCRPKAGQSYDRMVEDACAGGADVIQFRDKVLSAQVRYEIARRLRAICWSHKVLFIVNDALDIALAIEADGVHLGQDDLPLPVARAFVYHYGAKAFLIGRSTHSLAQALEAERQGADYIGVGPVFSTPTKPSYAPVGLALVRQVAHRVKVPQVAIGGIEATNVEHVLEAGAKRVAVVRAVCGAVDTARAAEKLKTILSAEKSYV